MKIYLLLLTIGLIAQPFNYASAQQDAPTVTSIKQELLELKAIREENLITETEYKKKEKHLQGLLKKYQKQIPQMKAIMLLSKLLSSNRLTLPLITRRQPILPN